MWRLWANGARNVVAGVLIGYGGAAFLCLLGLTQAWFDAAPSFPDPGHGLIYPHNSHGIYRYFSAFQATATGLPFMLTIPMVFLGALIGPKKNVVFPRWDVDDPMHLQVVAAILTVIATPFLLWFLGPVVINAMISKGFIWNAG